MKKAAVIGLGQMGGAIAARLHASGADVVGYDVSPAMREAAARDGLRIATSVGAAIDECEAVITCLPNSAIVESVWLGDTGLVAQLRAGITCIEMSSIDPDTMLRVGSAAQDRGATVLDCPVSGSPGEARQGKLVLLVGGETTVLEAARPLLAMVSGNIRHAGAIGAGKTVKIVNNMMTMANILAASEAFSLGVHAGVDPQVLLDILSVSGGRSAQFLKRFPWAVAGDFAPRFKMELGEKDLALGVDLGRAVGQPTPIASMARELYALAMAQGHQGRDIVALYDMYQHWTRDKKAG